jgi:hypothetical protein
MKKESPKYQRQKDKTRADFKNELKALVEADDKNFRATLIGILKALHDGLIMVIEHGANQREMLLKAVGKVNRAIQKDLKTANENFNLIHEELVNLQEWAFLISLLINQMRGLPFDMERNQTLAEIFRVDIDKIRGNMPDISEALEKFMSGSTRPKTTH